MKEQITELLEAYAAKKKAYDECEYDASYFCHREDKRLEEAEEDFNEALIEIIDQRIQELTGAC